MMERVKGGKKFYDFSNESVDIRISGIFKNNNFMIESNNKELFLKLKLTTGIKVFETLIQFYHISDDTLRTSLLIFETDLGKKICYLTIINYAIDNTSILKVEDFTLSNETQTTELLEDEVQTLELLEDEKEMEGVK